MKKSKWKSYTFWILLSEAVGVISAWLTQEGIRTFSKLAVQPQLTPPAVIFPIVWAVLFALMGIGAARVCLSPFSEARSLALLLFLIQLGFNFFWSIIFFNYRAYGLALIWIILLCFLIVFTIFSFRRVDKTAAWLLIPYLLWVSFATYLNFVVWLLNR